MTVTGQPVAASAAAAKPGKPGQARAAKTPRLVKQLNVDVGEGPVYKEKQYSITELMVLWAPRCRNTIRKLVMFEPGVVKVPGPTEERTMYMVPESVVRRIHTRLSS
jgi:hypothetical protein